MFSIEANTKNVLNISANNHKKLKSAEIIENDLVPNE